MESNADVAVPKLPLRQLMRWPAKPLTMLVVQVFPANVPTPPPPPKATSPVSAASLGSEQLLQEKEGKDDKGKGKDEHKGKDKDENKGKERMTKEKG